MLYRVLIGACNPTLQPLHGVQVSEQGAAALAALALKTQQNATAISAAEGVS